MSISSTTGVYKDSNVDGSDLKLEDEHARKLLSTYLQFSEELDEVIATAKYLSQFYQVRSWNRFNSTAGDEKSHTQHPDKLTAEKASALPIRVGTLLSVLEKEQSNLREHQLEANILHVVFPKNDEHKY